MLDLLGVDASRIAPSDRFLFALVVVGGACGDAPSVLDAEIDMID
jgi:hypothetical protein